MSSKEMNLHSFVQHLSDGVNGKVICHYKRVPTLIDIYNGMMAYKNLVGLSDIIIPEVTVDISNNKLTFRFRSEDISDFKQFSDCIRKYSGAKRISIRENTRKQMVTVRV